MPTFYPICTTEIDAWSPYCGVPALNCVNCGLVRGSRNSHRWLKTIREKIEYGRAAKNEIFPIIDDVSTQAVASLYGMIQPRREPRQRVGCRSEMVLRAMIYYLTIGNFDEIRRVLVGLQTIDGIALPADWNWRRGDRADEGRRSEKPRRGCYDWFISASPKEEIEKKIGREGCRPLRFIREKVGPQQDCVYSSSGIVRREIGG